jgi:hypothetical protein
MVKANATGGASAAKACGEENKVMKLEAAATRVLALAKAIRDYWAVELPKRHPNYPLVDPDADSGPPPPEEKALRQFLTRLAPETVYKLALVMYLGRGDCDTSDLPAEYQAVKENFNSPAALIAQMLEKAPLADYLEEGMAILRSRHIDLDKLDLTTAGA